MENKERLYAVRDEVAEEFGPLFTAKNDGVAKRKFDELVKSVSADVKGDYVLYFMGIYDIEKGGIFSELREIKIGDMEVE